MLCCLASIKSYVQLSMLWYSNGVRLYYTNLGAELTVLLLLLCGNDCVLFGKLDCAGFDVSLAPHRKNTLRFEEWDYISYIYKTSFVTRYGALTPAEQDDDLTGRFYHIGRRSVFYRTRLLALVIWSNKQHLPIDEATSLNIFTFATSTVDQWQ